MRLDRTSMALAAGVVLWLIIPIGRAEAQRDPKVVRRAERSYKPRYQVDAFTRDSTTEINIYRIADDPQARCSHEDGTPLVRLSLRKLAPPRQEPALFLHADYSGWRWLTISADDSLRLMVDDSLLVLQPQGHAHYRNGIYANEAQSYRVTRDDLSRLARAGSVRARLSGRSGRCDFRLKPESLELVRLFLQRELRGTAMITSER
jgi:hypothetical protein